MSAHDVAEQRQRELQRIARRVEATGVAAWRDLNTTSIAASWAELSPTVIATLILAQQQAAAGADAYTGRVLSELNIDTDPAGRVVPSSLSGLAADGRPLRSLLFVPVVVARSALGRGEPLTRALTSGQASLRLILRTETMDAGRVADGVSVASRPTVGYVRQLTPPSCPRCAILAGKFYRFNAGFQRHPACDCVHIPSAESVAGDLTTDPRAAFDAGQIRGLSQADAKAIADGADMNRVVNAHRGMYTAGGRKFTHALAGRQGVPRVRIRPEQIYRDATSRTDAIRLLRLHGYLS